MQWQWQRSGKPGWHCGIFSVIRSSYARGPTVWFTGSKRTSTNRWIGTTTTRRLEWAAILYVSCGPRTLQMWLLCWLETETLTWDQSDMLMLLTASRMCWRSDTEERLLNWSTMYPCCSLTRKSVVLTALFGCYMAGATWNCSVSTRALCTQYTHVQSTASLFFQTNYEGCMCVLP